MYSARRMRLHTEYLCLVGCWFGNPEYMKFHEALEDLKTRHLPHHPDDPVVLHRDDMINARKAFKNLRNEVNRTNFDAELLRVVETADFKVVAVVIDKLKSANIAGLQLADLLGHPVKHRVLRQFGHINAEVAPFAHRLLGVIEGKFNRHLYDGRVEGYGMVLFPRK